MQAVQFNPKIHLDFQDILKGLSELPVSDLEQLVGELNQVIEQRKKLPSKDRANELVQKIKHGGPSKEFHAKLMQLFTKSVKEKISEEERAELSAMVPTAEKWSVERLEYLMELSQLWEISVDEVMKKLDIQPPPVIHA
ncbi:MAG: hypothetical protein AAGG68_01995 [Bacteroidota bacterium]